MIMNNQDIIDAILENQQRALESDNPVDILKILL